MVRIASIQLESPQARSSDLEPVVVGVPMPRTLVTDMEKLRLTTPQGVSKPAYFRMLAEWPDGSCKWAALYFQADKRCGLLDVDYVDTRDQQHQDSRTPDQGRVTVEELNSVITIDTGAASFIMDLEQSLPFKQVSVNGIDQLSGDGSRLTMENHSGGPLSLTISSRDLGDTQNPWQRTLKLTGQFFDSDRDPVVDISMQVSFFAGLAAVKIDTCILNPRAAVHSKGVWDLGDAGSVMFDGLVQEVDLSTRFHDEIALSVKPEQQSEWEAIGRGPYALYQDSSGGDNWRSNNHVNAQNEIAVSFRGYRGSRDGIELHRGLRADPQFRCASDSANLYVYIADFWQNFPKAVEANGNRVRLKLFPNQFSDVFELQGGEQKTHTYFLDFGEDLESSSWVVAPRLARIEAAHYANTRLIPFLPETAGEDELQNIINLGISGNNSFFEKREAIDEYGWRNFGDIYADHEQLEYTGSQPLISHYNNQYDVLDGFLRQYIVTQEKPWFELARDLARHIVDIDIYNTTQDKDQYNGGLFWHTDHYSNAFTCTHRTFSSKNLFSYDGEVGGGPGAEHCYTAGLASFYFLTGDPTYKDAVLKLVDWISRSLEGSGTLLERFQLFVGRDISTIRKLLSGHNLPKYRYPFNRATGNYISSLLDAYHLTSDREYLHRAESVIENTVHPGDDITLRQLDDIEINWSYLIFLQAICKYLVTKSALDEVDAAFYYARECLLHYADWIAENERPFLDSKERLEFVNSTWTAQDLRKAYVLRVAACFDTENKDVYLSRSRYFRDYVSRQLMHDEHRHYARIIVILMQNRLPDDDQVENWLFGESFSPGDISFGTAPIHSLGGILIDFLGDVMKRLRHLSIGGEIRWLKVRIRGRY